MEGQRFERLAAVMAAMGAGERAAVFSLYREFGGDLAAFLRRELRRLGVEHAAADDVDGLVVDACLVLLECGGAWRPDGGALPWTWARRRLAELAWRAVGQHADPLDAEVGAGREGVVPAPCSGDDPELDVLSRLAAHQPGCALVLEALERVASRRDRALLLELRSQAAAGDPSPACTISSRHGVSADVARQAASRVRVRLRRLAATDPRFAGLVDLPLVV